MRRQTGLQLDLVIIDVPQVVCRLHSDTFAKIQLVELLQRHPFFSVILLLSSSALIFLIVRFGGQSLDLVGTSCQQVHERFPSAKMRAEYTGSRTCEECVFLSRNGYSLAWVDWLRSNYQSFYDVLKSNWFGQLKMLHGHVG